MKKLFVFSVYILLIYSFYACGTTDALQDEITGASTEDIISSVQTPSDKELGSEGDEEDNETMKMNVQVGNMNFTATLEENEAVDAFVEMMKTSPVVISMKDYSGFEKVGSLGKNLPASNSQTTTQPGDIVLYNGNQIVLFYGSNSWSYTRLGKIDELSGLEKALGRGDVTVTFSIE